MFQRVHTRNVFAMAALSDTVTPVSRMISAYKPLRYFEPNTLSTVYTQPIDRIWGEDIYLIWTWDAKVRRRFHHFLFIDYFLVFWFILCATVLRSLELTSTGSHNLHLLVIDFNQRWAI